MKMTVLDGNGVAQIIFVPSPATLVDQSGVISATGTAQPFLAVNLNRTGFFIQNNSLNPIYLNEIGGTATTSPVANNGSIVIPAGASFPPMGYPVPTTAMTILGTLGSAYTAREW